MSVFTRRFDRLTTQFGLLASVGCVPSGYLAWLDGASGDLSLAMVLLISTAVGLLILGGFLWAARIPAAERQRRLAPSGIRRRRPRRLREMRPVTVTWRPRARGIRRPG